jgi:uncharacterized membrane protein/energy-coupling factor transporter transmembrane protein EcfT
MEKEENKEVIKIALLVSCACVLQVAETLIPHPVPGVRLGLANLITLVAMVHIGFRVSLQIALLRTVISSLILGTFLSPSFLLSFSGSLVSTFIMGALFKLSTGGYRVRFSLVGISIMGSLGHNMTQVSLAYLLLVKNSAIFLLWPWLLISGVIMGWITGMISIQVCKKLKTTSTAKTDRKLEPDIAVYPGGRYVDKSSPIHLLSPRIKIIGVILLTLLVLFSGNYWGFASVFATLIVLAILSRIRILSLLSGIEKLTPLLILSFTLPLLFTSGKILLSIGSLSITQAGLHLGISLASRIVIVYSAASLLSQTTSPRDIATGLESLLSPLKMAGLSVNNLTRTLVLTWTFFPVLWAEARNAIRDQKFEARKLRNPIDFSSDLIVGLYERADQISKEVS